jgi:acyl-CoA thioester hydrolase
MPSYSFYFFLSLYCDYDRLNVLSLVSDFHLFRVITMKKITFDLDIYSYQIDFTGQVHNAVYINWMEIGRIKLLDAVGLPISTLLSQGSIPALASTTIAYKTPLFQSDRVWIEMWLSALGYASAVMRFNFYNTGCNTKNPRDQVLAAEGYQRSMFVDKDTLKSKRFTRQEKDAFLPYVEEQPMESINLLPKSPRFRAAMSRSNK